MLWAHQTGRSVKETGAAVYQFSQVCNMMRNCSKIFTFIDHSLFFEFNLSVRFATWLVLGAPLIHILERLSGGLILGPRRTSRIIRSSRPRSLTAVRHHFVRADLIIVVLLE